MTFPNTPLSTTVQLYINGVWTDITSDVYHRDPITITRGRTSYADDVDPSRCQLTLNNTTGKYSPRNPAGTYYGKIGRNTPLRVSVKAGSVALDLPGATGDYASTPDNAALDITGDIDVRIDGTFFNWVDAQNDTLGFNRTELIGKLAGAPQKAWQFAVQNGALYLEWSADGTNVLSASSTVPLPAGPDTRMAVRVTLDVNNGASGNTVTFYTADTLSGTWVQLGDPVITAGTTSIFNSTAALRIGDASSFAFAPAAGSCHAAQVRNGIGGTIVANPDFGAQADGATSFTDSAGRSWSLSGSATLTNRKVRFVGEVSEWPAEWDVSGRDVYTQVTASGILRRLAQGQTPIKSTLTRRLPTLGPSAYWPMEDGSSSTVAYSPIAGVADMSTHGLTFAAVDTLAGSSALPTISSGATIEGIVPAPVGTQIAWGVEFVYNLNASPSTYRTLMVIKATGTVKTWYLQLSGTGSRILGYDDDGNVIVSDARATGTDLSDGRWNRWQHRISQLGGTVTYTTSWVNVGGSGGSATGTYSGFCGRVVSVGSPETGYSSELGSMAIGHLSVFMPYQATAYNNVDTGQNGERAGVRLTRLAGEEAIAMSVQGYTGIQAQLGPQKPAAILDILKDCADADGGILYEQRGTAGLIYRDKSTLFNQRVRVALDYTTAGHISPPFKPVDDDQLIKNDITVTRKDGASAVSELTSGALSTAAPPSGVGRYQDSTEQNLYDDTQPAQAAEWLLYLGTWDEARYPTVHVDLAAGPSLIDAVAAADVGDRLTVAHPPAWLPPDSIDCLIQGYTEVIEEYGWDVTFNCSPGGPWSHVGQVGTARADTAGTSLGWDIGTSDTWVGASTTTGPVWSEDPNDFPFDIKVAGERMTVTTVGAVLNSNEFFNTDTSSWAASNATIARSTAVVNPNGIASLLITPNGSSASGGANGTATAVGTITAGANYYAYLWAYSPAGWSDLRPAVDWFDSSGVFLSTGLGSAFVVPAGVWTLLRQTLTAPASASKASLRARHGGTPAVTDIWYVWGARLTSVTTATVSPQTFTTTRAVNGVLKAHTAGEAISLWSPSYVPLDWGSA